MSSEPESAPAPSTPGEPQANAPQAATATATAEAPKPAPKAAPAAEALPDIDSVEEVELENLVGRVHVMADEGRRFVTLTCLDSPDCFEIYYHFDKDHVLHNLLVRLPKDKPLPTITHAYFSAFLVENELKCLFGIQVEGLSVDYAGKLLVVDDGTPPPLLKSTKFTKS